MAQRSPEIHYWIALPMMVLLGFVLHLPLILESLSLLPQWVNLNKEAALLLIWSTLTGCSLSAVVYLGTAIPKPVRLPWKQLQDLFAYDFYTQNLYRNSIVLSVALASNVVSWFDRYLIDGAVNLLGIFTIFSGQSLKYSTSGQSQFYMLTVVLGVAFIALSLGLPIVFPETFNPWLN
jgi:NAD(P)H-quinone oxidoreductase subunit 5